jgi:hypothetical protein
MANPNSAVFPAAVAADSDLFPASNNITLALAAPIGAGDATFTVVSAAGVNTPCIVTFGAEIIHCTTLVGAVFSGLTRGAQGTAAAAHAITVPGYLNTTAWHHNQVAAEVRAIELAASMIGLIPGVAPNLKAKSIFGSALAAGQNDLYTVPAGRRLFVIQVNGFQTAGASGTINLQTKVGGTYYSMTGNIATTLNTFVAVTSASMALEAGETLSVFTVGTTINVPVAAWECDAAGCNVKSARLFGTAAGANLIYTCPALKTAISLGVNFIQQGPAFEVVNDASGAHTFQAFFVPAGQAADLAHQITQSASVAASARLNFNTSYNFAAGDALYITPSANSAAQVAWINILEL